MSAIRKGGPSRSAPPRAPRTIRKPDTHEELEQAALDQAGQQYVLRLYVTGATPASSRAIEKVRAICEEHLHGRYELEVIDIYQMPALAQSHQIIATPTLIKVLPVPLRRLIGDLSNTQKILFGLDLHEKK